MDYLIKSVEDKRTFDELLRGRKIREKTLFPEDWTEEDIGEAFAKAEDSIKEVLLKEYGLPEYSPGMQGNIGRMLARNEI